MEIQQILEYLIDIDMHLKVQKGMRGGISTVSHRQARNNNPLVEGYDTSPKNPGWCKVLPTIFMAGWWVSTSQKGISGGKEKCQQMETKIIYLRFTFII